MDNTMFFTSTFSIVHAVDAKTGIEKSYDPYPRLLCCGPINRGVAVYQGKVYVGTWIAASSPSMPPERKFGKSTTIIDTERNYSITGAPRAAKGKILSAVEFGVRAMSQRMIQKSS